MSLRHLFYLLFSLMSISLFTACGGSNGSDARQGQGETSAVQSRQLQAVSGKALAIDLELKGTQGSALRYRLSQAPRHGKIEGTPPKITYTPDATYRGKDHLRFDVIDAGQGMPIARIDLEIQVVGPNEGKTTGAGGTDISTGSDDNGSAIADSDDNTTGGSDNNGTTASENNPSASSGNNNASAGGSSDNGSSGSEINGSTGGNNSHGTSGGSDSHTSTGGNDNAAGGSDDNTSTGGGTHTVALKSLKLEIVDTTLNRDHNTTITLKALYDDNTTNTPNNIEWLITPKDAVRIQGNTLTALKDTNVTIQAKVGNILSNQVHLNIYWEVDGHRLPPEPDPKVNNATLLGVDVNHNGVRDDVERWIYKTYHHPIERGIFMQSARAYQKVIVDPSKAKETMKYIDNSSDCEGYWRYWKYLFKNAKEDYTLERYRDLEKEIRPVQFNTLDRIIAYHRFNKKLSGGVYGQTGISKTKCEFDENGILKAER